MANQPYIVIPSCSRFPRRRRNLRLVPGWAADQDLPGEGAADRGHPVGDDADCPLEPELVTATMGVRYLRRHRLQGPADWHGAGGGLELWNNAGACGRQRGDVWVGADLRLGFEGVRGQYQRHQHPGRGGAGGHGEPEHPGFHRGRYRGHFLLRLRTGQRRAQLTEHHGDLCRAESGVFVPAPYQRRGGQLEDRGVRGDLRHLRGNAGDRCCRSSCQHDGRSGHLQHLGHAQQQGQPGQGGRGHFRFSAQLRDHAVRGVRCRDCRRDSTSPFRHRSPPR